MVRLDRPNGSLIRFLICCILIGLSQFDSFIYHNVLSCSAAKELDPGEQKWKNTPFMDACLEGDLQKITTMSSSANNLFKEVNGFGDSPLHLAVFSQKIEVVKYTQSKTTNCLPNFYDDTPLHVAAFCPDVSISRYLFSVSWAEQRNHEGNTPSLIAASVGNVGFLKMVKQKLGYLPDYANNLGQNISIIAAAHGHSDAVEYALRNGSRNNSMDHAGLTVIHHCAASGLISVFKSGVFEQFMFWLPDINGLTPLHHAIQNGRLVLVQYLVSQNTSNARDSFYQGRTIMHYAAVCGQLEIMKYLFDKGFSYTDADSVGFAPIHLAAQQGFDHIIEYLVKEQAVPVDTEVSNLVYNSDTPFLIAAMNGRVSTLELLKTLGANTTKRTTKGATALLSAAWNGEAEAIEWLLQNGASIEEVDSRGSNILDMLVSATHKGLASKLKQKYPQICRTIEEQQSSDQAEDQKTWRDL